MVYIYFMGFIFGLLKGIIFGFAKGIRLFIFLVFLVGLALGVAVVLLIKSPNKGEIKGKLIRQDADILKVEMIDGATRDVRLLFREGATVELKGNLSGNLLEVKEIEVR